MRPTAGNAALRPAQKRSRSSSLALTRQATAPQPRAIASTRRDEVIDLGRRPVELDDQQRLDIERIAGMDEILGGVDRGLVHHLHAAGNDAGADDRARRNAPALSFDGKADQHRARRRRLLQDAHRHLGDDAQQPFGADGDAQEIVALGVEMLAAEPHHLAVDQHQLDAQHVVGGEPVFEAMHAARILGDVAADRAGDLARRIGRVVEACMLRPRS